MNKNSFEPQTMFETYVKITLDNMEKRLDALPCIETSKRLNKCENDISNIKGKTTIISIIMGSISAIFTKYIFGK